MQHIEDYSSRAYDSLMKSRISRILMICSNYDAFIMEEDGRIESRVAKEYTELNLSSAPKFIWANSSAAARITLESDADIDMIICMYNDTDKDIITFAEELKAQGRNIPFVLLMHYSKEIRKKVTSAKAIAAVDFVFSWHGNADLILAIIKLFEDKANADSDILSAGVQAILLVEDSIRYYSTYLPELYKLVLTQSNEFLKETLNESQQRNRKRSRPKILLATCYEDAVVLYKKYSKNLLGVISDVGMVIHKGDSPGLEKFDAGIDLVNLIRRDDPQMPVLMQSSQGDLEIIAKQAGAGFLRKYSRTLFMQLSDYIREEFGFGDFVFRDTNGVEYGRAANLQELEGIIKDIPDNVLVLNTSRNMFSKWFYARGLYTLAARFRSEHHIEANSAREFISEQIRAYHKAMGRGIIARFSEKNYENYISFACLGEGSLGGKARGLAFLNKLIEKYDLTDAYDDISISIPRTIVINTDYFDQFIVENGLQYVIDSELSDDEIVSEFVASRLPEALISQLKSYLETINTPLAIRSSSKLEDSNYQPFAGVYSTYMIPMSENKGQMLRMLDKAIKSVYASAYFNGSRTYIQSTGNLQSEEKMAVIIQNICGSAHSGLYFPLLSGVARSINFYPIGNEKSEDGIVNMVFGLGKSVVEGGHTLRFSPRFPKKILQMSQPELAIRDTQTMLYALDLRPGAFKISKNDSINFAYVPVSDTLEGYPYPSMVCSTLDISNNRIVPGIEAQGPRIVSYDSILKYNRFPLAKAITDIMEICKKEMMCDVEIEFAADIADNGERLSFKLLQVRPISQFADIPDTDAESVTANLDKVLISSDKALGAGYFNGISHIVIIEPDRYDSTATLEMRREIAEINHRMKTEDKGYVLIGPGRWGSADYNLGVPVIWSDISEARMIVECSILGYQIEPSQGTHFFQNITSLGIGYLSSDTVRNPEAIDFLSISNMKCVFEGKYARVLETPKNLVAFIDRNSNKAVIGL